MIPIFLIAGVEPISGTKRLRMLVRLLLHPTPNVTSNYFTRKLSSFLPFLRAPTSHFGRAPRPAHVLPSSSRYFGGTFRPLRERLPVAVMLRLARREICSWSSRRFSVSASSTFVRKSIRSFVDKSARLARLGIISSFQMLSPTRLTACQLSRLVRQHDVTDV